MQAIVTKYLPPTNQRGARVKAWAEAGSVTMGWRHSLNAEQNHIAAARRLAREWGWTGYWLEGGIDGGHVFVCLLLPESPELDKLAAFRLVLDADHKKVLDCPTKASADIDARMLA